MTLEEQQWPDISAAYKRMFPPPEGATPERLELARARSSRFATFYSELLEMGYTVAKEVPPVVTEVKPKGVLESLARKREERAALKVGDRVCVVGYGTANPVHQHHTVTGLTKLYVKTEFKDRHGDVVKDRHRIEDGRSTPYGPYGGTDLDTTCQRPHKA